MAGYIGAVPFTEASRRVREFDLPKGTTRVDVEYSVGFVDVILNGIFLSREDYVADNGYRITFNQPLMLATNKLIVISYNTFRLAEMGSELESHLAQNLNDIPNKTKARENLGLGSAATYNIGTSGNTIGSISSLDQRYVSLSGDNTLRGRAVILHDAGESPTYATGQLELRVMGTNPVLLAFHRSGHTQVTLTHKESQVLDLNASFRATGNVTAYSDIRKKENVSTITDALDKVTRLRGVNYTSKDTGSQRIGVIAQEIKEVLPEVVIEDESDEKMLSVDYGNIVSVLIEAIKEQQEQINELKELVK